MRKYFEEIKDKRQSWKVKHKLIEILVTGICTVISKSLKYALARGNTNSFFLTCILVVLRCKYRPKTKMFHRKKYRHINPDFDKIQKPLRQCKTTLPFPCINFGGIYIFSSINNYGYVHTHTHTHTHLYSIIYCLLFFKDCSKVV